MPQTITKIGDYAFYVCTNLTSINIPDSVTSIGYKAFYYCTKLTSINLLSGGEKTLTAICLIFAILNVKTIPFCLFDQVEAALDEANVDNFGQYLNNYKGKTQFLL